jgi:hypothetical protein
VRKTLTFVGRATPDVSYPTLDGDGRGIALTAFGIGRVDSGRITGGSGVSGLRCVGQLRQQRTGPGSVAPGPAGRAALSRRVDRPMTAPGCPFFKLAFASYRAT